MLRNFSNKYLFLKKYEVDLWGSLLFVKKASRIFNMVFEMLCLKHKSCIGYLRWHYNRLSWKGSFKYSISMPFKPDIKRRKKFYLWRLHATAVLRVYYGRRRNTKKFKKYIKQFKQPCKGHSITAMPSKYRVKSSPSLSVDVKAKEAKSIGKHPVTART